MPQTLEPGVASARAKLPVPGDYSKSSQMMNAADKSLYLSQQTDHFILKVRQRMSPSEIKKLPTDNTGYVNAMVTKSLDHVDAFHEDLADMIIARYYLTPQGERYVFDPVNKGILFVNEYGELVTLIGAKIKTEPRKDIQETGNQIIESYEKRFVWTGPHAEKEFEARSQFIPEPKLPEYEVISVRPERTKITPEMRTDLLFNNIREKMAELGKPVTPRSSETADFVDAHIKAALENIDLFKDELADTIAFLYHFRPTAERFFRDPNTGGALFVDPKGDIVILNNIEIKTAHDGSKNIKYTYAGLESVSATGIQSTSTALTGIDKGKKLTYDEKPIPQPIKPLQYRVLPSK